MNFSPQVAVIIINWNRKDLLGKALLSIANDGFSDMLPIVVDNNSSDGSQGMIKSEFPNTILILNEENVGYARGNNQGIERALETKADYIFFMNNDAEVRPGCIEKLVAQLSSDPYCGAAAPYITYAENPDVIWFGGGSVALWSGQVRHSHIRQKYDPDAYGVEFADYLTGCALLVKREVLERLGGFDERFALYSEDVDLCLRIRKAGWSLKVVPSALAVHKVSASTGGGISPVKAFYRARSTALLLRMWAPVWAWLILPFAGTIGVTIVVAGLVLGGKASIAMAIIRGIINGFTGRKIPMAFQLDFTK